MRAWAQAQENVQFDVCACVVCLGRLVVSEDGSMGLRVSLHVRVQAQAQAHGHACCVTAGYEDAQTASPPFFLVGAEPLASHPQPGRLGLEGTVLAGG